MPVREALAYIGGIIGTEINSATDNPLICEDGESDHICNSGGHFQGAYVARRRWICSQSWRAISERRLARTLIDTKGWIFLAVLTAICLIVPLRNLVVPEGSPLHLPTYLVSLFGKYLSFALLARCRDLV